MDEKGEKVGKTPTVRRGRPKGSRNLSGEGKKARGSRLSALHRRLVEWYFHPSINFNKKAAMLRCGYSESVASTAAFTVFNREDVKQAIAEKHEEIRVRFSMDREWISRHLQLLSTAAPAYLLARLKEVDNDPLKLTAEEQYQIGEIKERHYMMGRGEDATPVTEISVKGENRTASLQALAKLHGLNEEKPEGTQVNVAQIIMAGRARLKRPGS